MTPHFAAGLCSLMGAIFCFGAGFFFARHKISFNQEKYEKKIQFAKEQEESAREKAIQENLSFKRNIDMQKQKNDAYQKATQKRIAELKEQVEKSNSVLGDYKERLNDLAVEITRADSEKVLLTEALEVTKRDLKDIVDLEQEKQDLAAKLDFFKSELKELEHLRHEKHSLMARVSELEPLQEQVRVLKTEIKRADFIKKSSLKPRPTGDSSAREGLGKVFQSIVNEISKLDGSHGVVVADELGLLIAGTGEHMDNMAAMAAIFSELDVKLSALIPFGSIVSIKISGLDDINITMHPFDMYSEKVVLTVLAIGEGPNHNTIAQLTQQAIAS